MNTVINNQAKCNFGFSSPPIFSYCLCELFGISEQLNSILSSNFNNNSATFDEANNPKVIWMKSIWWAAENLNKGTILNQTNNEELFQTNSLLNTKNNDDTPKNFISTKNKNGIINNVEQNNTNTNLNSVKNNLSDSTKPNTINLDALKGHKYEIRPNSNPHNHESNYEYICKYDNCGKSFNKTYNLVYHFRVHTNEKPFQWQYCKKYFSQKGNLGRHLERHKTKTVEERKLYQCNTCSKSYTSIYNLRVS